MDRMISLQEKQFHSDRKRQRRLTLKEQLEDAKQARDEAPTEKERKFYHQQVTDLRMKILQPDSEDSDSSL